MTNATDVLFVTHLQPRGDTGDASVYRPLRLAMGGIPATIPVLRLVARGLEPETAVRHYADLVRARSDIKVLTPIFLREYLARRGLSLVELPSLAGGKAELRAAFARGVGLVALNTTWVRGPAAAHYARRAAAAIRRMAPDVPILVGGVNARKGWRARELSLRGELPGVTMESLRHDFLLADPELDACFDAVAIGEDSAATLAAVAARVRDGRDFRDLPGLAVPEPGGYRFTAAQPEADNLDDELVDWSRYARGVPGFEAPVQTARGCPFACQFCDFAGLYRPQLRSLDSLVAELRSLPAPRRVFFTDDNVALNRSRLVALTRALVEARLDLTWRAFIRADTVDAQTADLLAASGCRECLLGIESADPEVLRNMDKHLDPDHALEAVHLLDARGIQTQCTFVVGFPGETAESLERTAAFLSALPAGESARSFHRYYLFRFQVSALAPVARPAARARFGLTGTGEAWSHATMNSNEALQAVHDLFQAVSGPTHAYLEPCPTEWSSANVRRVLETRERLCKEAAGGHAPDMASLVALVRQAEGGTAAPPTGARQEP